MQRIIGFVLLLCCIFSLYTWTFEPDNVVVSGAGASVGKDAYGNNVDENGFVVPEYYDDKLSGDFYEAASKPFAFINDVAVAFDGMRTGIVAIIKTSTTATESLITAIDSIFNFNDDDSWWANIWNNTNDDPNADYPGGSRGER